jgi:hypothetical protein
MTTIITNHDNGHHGDQDWEREHLCTCAHSRRRSSVESIGKT